MLNRTEMITRQLLDEYPINLCFDHNQMPFHIHHRIHSNSEVYLRPHNPTPTVGSPDPHSLKDRRLGFNGLVPTSCPLQSARRMTLRCELL